MSSPFELLGMCKLALARGFQFDIEEAAHLMGIQQRQVWGFVGNIPRVERKRALHEKRRLKQVYYEVMVS